MTSRLREIRICYVHANGLMELNNLDGDALMNNYGHTIRRSALKRGWNATFNPVSSFFSPDGNDCIGQMQRNESDVSLVLWEYPFMAPNITVGHAAIATKDTMLTVYDKEKFGNHSTRVMDFLEGFSPASWIITILSMALLYFLILATLMSRKWMRPGRSLRRKDMKWSSFFKAFHNTNDMLIGSVLKQMSCCCNVIPRPYTTALFTGMYMIGFYCGFYLTGMIKTAMVVTEPPPTYNSYQDLVDQDVIPKWVSTVEGQKDFVEAKTGSASRKLWDAAVRRGLDKSLVDVTLAESLISNLPPILERKASLITVDVARSTMVANWCSYMRRNGLYPNINFYWRQDAEAKEHLRTFLNSAFASKIVTNEYKRMTMRMFEAGMMPKEMSDPLKRLFSSADGIASLVEECKSGVILEKDHEMVAMGITHYWDLCLVYILSLCVALIILLIERLIKMSWRRRRVIRRRRTA